MPGRLDQSHRIDDPHRRSFVIGGAALYAGGLACIGAARAADSPNIAVASNLQFALPEIATVFARETGRNVRLSFGSSGNFRQQIAAGAPFELFLSADEAFVDALVREGRTLDSGVVYAVGRLVLVAPADAPYRPDPELRGLARAVADGRVRKFAIANPQLAPYGAAARMALTHAGVWKAIETRLVLGENIGQTAQFALSGAAQGGIVAYSLVRSPTFANRGGYALLPATMHEPLLQKMVLLGKAGETARLFYRFLQGSAARAIFVRYGFETPPA